MTAPAIATEQRPRLLLFYQPSSGATVKVNSFLAQVLQHRQNHNTFLIDRIDVSQRPDLAERFRIQVTPAICIDDNKVAVRAVAPRGVGQLRQLLQPWLH